MVKQSTTTTTSGGAGDERNDTRFKGVRKRKWGKYVSEIRLPNSRERIWLGSYDSAEKAARAFDAALFCLRGHSAKFNFPDNPPDIPGGRSLSPPEIQAAAASFANSSEAHPPQPPPPPQASLYARPESGPESPSQSLSLSDGSLTAQMDGEFPNDTSFTEFLSNMVLNPGYDSGYGLFPGFDDLGADFYAPPFSGTNDYVVEDNYYEEVVSQESFLWNF